mgnify:CR=1 FL=1
MKYKVKTSGKLCHYQFSNITEIEVNDIEFGEMDYHALEDTFLLDRSSFENQKISVDDEVKFEIFNESNNKILEFYSKDLEQTKMEVVVFVQNRNIMRSIIIVWGHLVTLKVGGQFLNLKLMMN